jgi:molybdopterin-guanine dinucleotide biosynthesis protein A
LEISCVVLAGGKGLRLGRDKASERLGDKSILQRVVLSLSSFSRDIVLVTAEGQYLHSSCDYPKVSVVTDAYPGKSALGGIYTGLAAAKSHYSVAVACDMPFLNQALLSYMVQLTPGFDAVVPRLGDMVEPLHAIYSKECLFAIESLLKQDKLGVTGLLALVKVRYVEADEIDRFDPEHRSFFNINTEADLNRAKRLLKNCLITLK